MAMRTGELQIDYLSVGQLNTTINRARIHPKRQITKLASSIREFGFLVPLLIDDSMEVVSGAGRLEAAIKLGMATVPVIRVSHLTEAQRRAFIIADNRLAEQSTWSKQLLRAEFKELVELGYDLEQTGFDTLEIDTMLTLEPDPKKEDDVVRLPVEDVAIISRPGDLWHIGKHRLLVGSALEIGSFETLLGEERAQFVLTDPPYGCRIEGNVSGLGAVKHDDFLMGATGKLDAAFSHAFLRPALKNLRIFALPGAIAMIFIDWRGAPFLLEAAAGVLDELKNLIVWAKSNAGMGTFYRSAHELIYAFKISPGGHVNNFGLGGRHRTNVWTYHGANVFRAGRAEDLADHPTVKPKKMLADAIFDCSSRNAIVLDCFAGSGSTLVAAAMTGRRGYGIELDPKYADVILRRLAEETGEVPMLGGVMPLPEVAASRATVSE